MKKQFYILLGIISLAVTTVSCELGGASNSTPDIYAYSPYILHDLDTLKFRYDKNYDLYLDTIAMGDTVQFTFQFIGYSNNIKRIEIDHKEEFGKLINLPADTLSKVFDSNLSDYDAGEYVVPGEIVLIVLPFQYTPSQVGNKGEIEIYVESDADFEANKRMMKFEIPVVEEN